MNSISHRERSIVATLIAIILVVGGMVAAAPQVRAEEDDEVLSGIEFINPTAGSSLRISDKQAKDATYSLSAWVGNARAVELVEFEIQSVTPVARAVTIGTATQVGNDTFEYLWTIPASLTDGRYSLRAIAYGKSSNGLRELDRDEETVTLLQGASSSTGAAETVDITAPVRAGKLGMFTPQGRPAGGVVDVTTSATNGWVRMFYTTTRPGSEPVWKPCGAQPTKKAADGVTCVLAATDKRETVTAISAIANATPYMDAQGKDTGKEQPDPTADQSSDAIRISTYEQIPTTLAIDPLTQKVTAASNGVFPCSPQVKAVLTDQLGDGIYGANIDVMATGPTSGTFFEVVQLVSKNQAPDKGAIPTESAYNCTGTATDNHAEKQGVHKVPGGVATKHMESLPTVGTDDAGAFPFRLYSDAAGTTQITAWVDVADDDRFCFGEPAAGGTIGWGEDAAEADPRRPDNCGTPVRKPRSIAMQASETAVTSGQKVTLAGAITSKATECVKGQKVKLQARRLGTTNRFKAVAKQVTNEVGVYKFSRRVRRGMEFRALAPATMACAKAKSVSTKVRTR